MKSSALASQISLGILEGIQTGKFAPGSHLTEQAIADEFRVSRSPARQALKGLKDLNVIRHHAHRGCFVASLPQTRLETARRRLLESDDDAPYRDIATQRLDGRLPEAFTEADLGRRFGLSRAETGRIVDRMLHEGWIERRPGYGWSFVPILTTPTSFDLGYRFRRIIEPAALLEPTFKPNPEAFARCRAEQQALADGRLKMTGSVQLYQSGSRFHEVLARCSGNPFFLDAVQRINRLRRLLEYRIMIDTRPFFNQAREHLTILDLVEAGKMKAAAGMMKRHLDDNRRVKLGILTGKSQTKRSERAWPLLAATLHF
jgi:DNA-binding GntR family transcriptional regulator